MKILFSILFYLAQISIINREIEKNFLTALLISKLLKDLMNLFYDLDNRFLVFVLCVHVCVNIYIYIYMCIFVFIYTFIYIYIYTYNIYIYTFINIIYIHIYIYIYIYILYCYIYMFYLCFFSSFLTIFNTY